MSAPRPVPDASSGAPPRLGPTVSRLVARTRTLLARDEAFESWCLGPAMTLPELAPDRAAIRAGLESGTAGLDDAQEGVEAARAVLSALRGLLEGPVAIVLPAAGDPLVMVEAGSEQEAQRLAEEARHAWDELVGVRVARVGAALRLPLVIGGVPAGLVLAAPNAWCADAFEAAAILSLRLERALAAFETEHARESLRRTASFASHELRNPISAILFATELLQRATEGDERWRRKLQTINGAAAEANLRIEWLTGAAALETGPLVARPQTLELSRFVGDVLSICRPVASHRGVTLEPTAPPLVVRLDRPRAHTALAAAAWAWTSRAPATSVVRISAAARGQAIHFRIAGTDLERLAPDARQALEDPAFRPSLHREASPLTIGLGVARGLAEALGGRLALRGGEAELELVLPIIETDGTQQ